MSFLVDNEIKIAINKKEIVIDPYDESRIAPGAYYLKLGNMLLLPEPGQTVDPSSNIDPNYNKVNISNDPYKMKPGEFLLGQTAEKISINDSYSMLIDGRTTNARLGLFVQLATFVHPGHKSSIITLELFNAGNHTIILKEGIDIAKGIFFRANTGSDNSYADVGKYGKQDNVTGARLG